MATETAASSDGGNWVKVKIGNLQGYLNKKFLSKNFNSESITNSFLGIWEYEINGHKEYLQIIKNDFNTFKFYTGYKRQDEITWLAPSIRNADGIYLKFSGQKLEGDFISGNFHATHGMEFTYKIPLEMESNNRLRYSVWSSIESKTDEIEAIKLN